MTNPSRLEANVQLRRRTFTLDVRISLPAEGVTVLTGHEGSGKTTLLRLISGWLRPQTGRIALDDQVWHSNNIHVRAHRRPVAMVFQDRRLIAHLNVSENLDFASRRAHGVRGPDRREVIETFGLKGLLSHTGSELSGGERLRVALAQGLLARPRLFLLDEALTGLDHRSRAIITPYLTSLCHRFQMAILIASHDQSDVNEFADRAVLMHKGKVTCIGIPQDVAAQMETAWPEPAGQR